ncbi:B-cell differentiation antigen CD72-like [Anolis sagrei]|uniref:B-cell differentiation antigen CD72-like n=1 Tax=Anolis sagrei TaxID=38937 RepID=UPI00351FD6A9
MAEEVTYADLRFVKNPPGNKTPREGHGAEEGELTYENVQGVRPAGKEETPSAPKEDTGSKPWLKGAALAVLTTCIILLAAAVGLGVRYWQVSGQLQRTLQKHAAQSTALAQRIDLQEGSLTQKEDRLRQAMAELSSTREALQKSQEATRKTQEQLREASHSLGTLKQEKDETEAELQQTTEKLASAQEALRESRKSTEKTQEQLQETEEFLREANRNLEAVKWEKEQMEANLHQATICRQADCCPDGWALFGWKCIWVSQERKTWQKSQEDCEEKSSQLLMPKESWEQRGIWSVLVRMQRAKENLQRSNGYWIGLHKIKKNQNWIFLWVDESRYEGCESRMTPKLLTVGKGDHRHHRRWATDESDLPGGHARESQPLPRSPSVC